MWSFEHALECPATPEEVWRVYTDIDDWPQWNGGVELLELAGPFEAGTSGMLTPRGQEPLPFVLISADPGRGYVSETAIADTVVLRTSNTLEPLPGGGTRIVALLAMHGRPRTISGPASDRRSRPACRGHCRHWRNRRKV